MAKNVTPIKTKRFPQDSIVLEVINNLLEVVWSKIAPAVKQFLNGIGCGLSPTINKHS